MHYRYPSDKALKSPATKNLGFFFLNQKLLWAPDASRFCLFFWFFFWIDVVTSLLHAQLPNKYYFSGNKS